MTDSSAGFRLIETADASLAEGSGGAEGDRTPRRENRVKHLALSPDWKTLDFCRHRAGDMVASPAGRFHIVSSDWNLYGTYSMRGATRRIRFTDRALKALKPPPRPKQVDYFDESLPGFGLRISYMGRKSWIVLYRCNGVKGRLTLGRVDLLPLADAREQARDALKAAASGDDPAIKKGRDREAPTFKQLADRYIEEYAKPNKRTWQKDRRLLDNNLINALGRKKAHLITRGDLRAELNRVKNRPAPVEANRTFEVVRRLFNWAIEEEILIENPVFKLPKPAEETPRERTLTADELQMFWRALGARSPIVRGVFRIMLLSAQRRNEVTRMRWVDLDRRDGWWNIPAELTKTKRPYRVPLTPAMLAIIEEIEKLALDPHWVFPRGEGGGPVPETNVTRPFRKLIKDAGIAHFVPHDLLHTVTSHMTAMGISQFDVGKIRHHTSRDSKTTTSRYDHYAYDREKRAALDAWSARLEQIIAPNRVDTSNVIALAR
jgi:integrase